MTELAQPDLTEKGLSYLLSYWTDKPNAIGLLRSFLEAFENPLDLLFEILNGVSLFDAEGAQLDLIGKLWQVDRQGMSDENYREALYSRITQNIADSTPEKVIEVLKVASSATEVKLFEHYPGNVHVGMNVALIESLKELGDSITAAGVSFNARFEPTHDNVSGTRPTAFEFRDFNLISGSWSNSNVTYTADTGVAPDGTTTLFTLEDSDAGNYGYRTIQVTSIDGTKKHFISCWVIKDAGATHMAALKAQFTGGGDDNYYLHIDPTDGSYTTTGLTADKVRVIDLDAEYFIWMEITPTSVDHDTLTISIYPAISTVLGTFEITAIGTTEFWTPVVAEVDETKHNSAYESQGTLVLSERILEEYFVIDEVGDSIVTELIEFIVADSDSKYTAYGSQPLAEYGNTLAAQPLTEVI